MILAPPHCRHRPRYLCVICCKREVPVRSEVCYGCRLTSPNLPRPETRR
jgi:hypothetical protein